MDIGTGITAAAHAISIAKALKGVEQSYDAAQFKLKLAEMLEALSDTRLALVEAKEALAEREAEIKRLKQTQSDRVDLIVGPDDYKYKTDQQGRRRGFPVCPKCDHVEDRIIQLVRNTAVDAAKCPACSSEYRPVTCYLEGGVRTLVENFREERQRKSDEQSRKMNAAYGRNTWMVR